jgi:hypothetical protein
MFQVQSGLCPCHLHICIDLWHWST